jgi:DNA-binding NarL/FixJ family response regulator
MRQLRRQRAEVRVVLLVAAIDDHQVAEAIRLGVRGIVLKEMAPQHLVHSIRRVHRGERVVDRNSIVRAPSKGSRRGRLKRQKVRLLTSREREVIRLVASGRRNRDIAAEMALSEGTVKTHLHSVYEKLHIGSRLELMLFAREHRLA